MKQYEVKTNDKKHYHLQLEQKEFDVNTGEKRSKAFIQMFSAREVSKVFPSLVKQGYTIGLLYSPVLAEAKEKVIALSKKLESLTTEKGEKEKEKEAAKGKLTAALDADKKATEKNKEATKAALEVAQSEYNKAEGEFNTSEHLFNEAEKELKEVTASIESLEASESEKYKYEPKTKKAE